MAMHSGEIYQAQAARFTGCFSAGFTRQAPYSRRTCPERCDKGMLCQINGRGVSLDLLPPEFQIGAYLSLVSGE